MKILYVTTVGITMGFFKALLKELISEGHSVDIACNDIEYPVDDYYKQLGCAVHHISCLRSPLKTENIKAMKELQHIISENNYDIVHCHTPVAGICARLACRKFRKNGLKVFYTAHGFHFYKGAPLKNWLLYYPAEKVCAHFTDVLITINQEDYKLAKRKMKAKRIEYVPGVGIDVDKFRNATVDRAEKRRELGIPEDAFLLISVGELNENKNHQVVIRALAQLNNPQVHYMIAGNGELDKYLTGLAARLGVANQVHLLGYRRDVAELYKAADIDVFPSKREGLGLSAIEGMAAGLPLICSDNRGTREYMGRDSLGMVSDCLDSDKFADAIKSFYKNAESGIQTGKDASERAGHFSVEKVNREMMRIYDLK